MIYLLIALLLFGLIQSLLELKKDNSAKSKWRIKKILSVIYIGGFIVGVFITFLQEQEARKLAGVIEGISSSVAKIDSVDKRLKEMFLSKDSLISQYEQVNLMLSKQIEFDQKRLEEKSALVGLMDYDSEWIGSDSTTYSIETCIRNFGKRNARITGGHGYAVFFDSDNKSFFNLDIPGNTMNGILEPNDIEGMRLCYYSHGVHFFQELKARTSFAVICLEIQYQDVLTKKNKIELFYSGWIPTSSKFGGLKDWQTNLAKKWATDNHK